MATPEDDHWWERVLVDSTAPIWDDPLGRTTAPIFDHASIIEPVLLKLWSQPSFPLLVQLWTPKISEDSQFFLTTQNFFLKTFDDALCEALYEYRKMSSGHDINYGEDIFRGTVFLEQRPMSLSDNALASLCLPVKWPSNDRFGVLEIVSRTEAICRNFFEEGRVCELFEEVGLICLGPDPLGMQDHPCQFTTGQVFSSISELKKWVVAVAKNYGFHVAITSSAYDKRPRIYFGCKSGTGTEECNCPFTLKASKTNGKWSLKVTNGSHNHSLAEHHDG